MLHYRQNLEEAVREKIRNIPDFPKEGIQFKDITPLFKDVSLFDVYEGKNLPNGKKSYAVSFILQDENKTLTDKQVDKIMGKLQHQFENQLGAELR